jgi:hypothetical protein
VCMRVESVLPVAGRGGCEVIVCSKCKKFVKNVEYMINGLEDIKDVTGICKKHGRGSVDWDDYEEVHNPRAKEDGR